ncbi:MAG: efflux RND transporter periplasmic adaptor subunit [Gammaproteobacteria bacterium]
MNIVKNTLLTILVMVTINFSGIAVAKKVDKQGLRTAYVEVTRLELSTDQEKISSTGNVVADPGIIVRSEIAGRVTKILFKPGENVVTGTSLIEIYPDIIKAELNQYQADLKLKEVSYQRFAKLHDLHVVSSADYDNALAARDSARALMEQANAKLRQTLLVASFSGRVGINLVNVGDYVSVGQDLVSLQALDPIYVDFSVPESYVHKISVNQEVLATSETAPNELFKGAIYAIDPLGDSKTRSIKVRAVFANKKEQLLPGTFASINILIGEKKQGIKIPQTSVMYDVAGDYVYKVVDDQAKKTPVVLGERDNQNVLIKQGLEVGDTIVTNGQMKITADGAPVVVVPAKNASN